MMVKVWLGIFQFTVVLSAVCYIVASWRAHLPPVFRLCARWFREVSNASRAHTDIIILCCSDSMSGTVQLDCRVAEVVRGAFLAWLTSVI